MKLISAVIAALALSFSMLLVPTTANATSTAYPGSVTTACGISVPARSHHHRIRVSFSVTAGNAVPTGNVKLRLYKKRAGGSYVIVKRKIVLYTGGVQKFAFRHLANGRYRVNARYMPPVNSVYKGCVSATVGTRLRG
ncbi:hypothetical protein ACVW00_003433 [Marmoricola sp. URHA0025 HA25]